MKKLSKKLVAKKLAQKVKKLLHNQKITIIVVTGSLGKTSAKIAIGKVLSTKFQVRFSVNSYNTDIGLPLSIFGIEAPPQLWDILAWQRIFQKINQIIKNYPYDVIVLEMAEDELDDMLKFLDFINPQYSVITSVAPVHMERLESMEKVVNDNWQIAKIAKKVFYNADQLQLAKVAGKSKKTQGFGLKNGVVKLIGIKPNNKGFLTGILKIKDETKKCTTKMLAEQGLYSLLAATSVGYELGLSMAQITRSIAKIEPVNGRMRLLAGVNGSRIIDDSYNSSPVAAIAALRALNNFKKRKIAVLGNMNELGSYSAEAHYDIGKAAAKVADMLVVIGKDAEIHTVAGAVDEGMEQDSIKIFKTPYEVGHFLKRIADKNDVILIKGSQNGVFLEEATRILLDPKLKPEDELVRQSPIWKRRKRKAFAL